MGVRGDCVKIAPGAAAGGDVVDVIILQEPLRRDQVYGRNIQGGLQQLRR